jgi:hypothetical protein
MQSGHLFKRITILLAMGLLLNTGAHAQQSFSCTCNCLKPMFDFLIASHRLFIKPTDNTTLINVIRAADAAGYKIDYRKCGFFYRNINKPFYAITTDSVTTLYRARIGDCNVALSSATGVSYSLYNLRSQTCGADTKVTYTNGGTGGAVAELKIDSCFSCEVVNTALCYSAITDSPVNPYIYGIAGNWRPAKSYVYYSSRKETDPAQDASIRTSGAINAFAPFWAVQNNKVTPQYNEARWVWNAASTLFNQRGFEVENKDPLGRYNAGLYGYNNTLPVAVIQNSRYRESAFDGFEDYSMDLGLCDTSCTSGRNFDFSGFAAKIDSTQKHTGKYSIRVDPANPVGISADLVSTDSDSFSVTVAKIDDRCTPGVKVLKEMRANAKTVLPPFSPLTGKTVLVSAWVKEGQVCTVPSYTNCQIGITLEPGAPNAEPIIAAPSGNIIEGWQRIEKVITIPEGATRLFINFQAKNSTTVYFDDVRIHPYNANMKSFVYNPMNLRLMAELDENNYATFYEYDDDGTLIRLKKETERGIKTIKETRTALLKEDVQ